MNAEVAILAGGFGSRLESVIGKNVPKPMAEINGKPLLEHQLKLCLAHGFYNVVILLHHLPDVIENFFGNGTELGLSIRYVVEKSPRGTAGAIYDALPLLSDQFLIIYGDTFLDVDLRAFWNAKALGDDFLTFAHPNSHPFDSDLLLLDKKNYVVDVFRPSVNEKKTYNNIVNAALYVAESSAFETLVPSNGEIDISSELFGKMISNGYKIKAYKSVEYIRDMGTPARYLRVQSDVTLGLPARLSSRAKRRCVFLDRDGVINLDVGHLSDKANFQLLDGVEQSIKKLNDLGYLVICVTNQPVIARGELTRDDLDEIHRYLEVLLGREGAYLDDIFYCPHHPDKGFSGEITELKVHCQCRKPAPGMLLEAIKKYNIDVRKSWMIGDHNRDIEAGKAAGVKTILLRSNLESNSSEMLADDTASSLRQAVEIIAVL